jgi:hypothetical protein
MLNDRGSDLLTLFFTNLIGLKPFQQYWNWFGAIDVTGCDGQAETLKLNVEIRLVRPDIF